MSMDIKPLATFVVLALLGPVLVVIGIELLDLSAADSTYNRLIGFWMPIALMASGGVMLIAAFRLLRYAVVGTAMVMGGIALMWSAPSLRPVTSAILVGIGQFIWSLLNGDSWQNAGWQYVQELADAFGNYAFLGREQIYQDLVFISGGLALTAVGAWFVIQRARMSQTMEDDLIVEFEEEDILRGRRTIIRVPLKFIPKEKKESLLDKILQVRHRRNIQKEK